MLVAGVDEDAMCLRLGVDDLARLVFDDIARVDWVDCHLGAGIGRAEQVFASLVDVDVGHLINQWRRAEMGELPIDVVDGERRHRVGLAAQLRVDEALVWGQRHRQADQRRLLCAGHQHLLDHGKLTGFAVHAEDIDVLRAGVRPGGRRPGDGPRRPGPLPATLEREERKWRPRSAAAPGSAQADARLPEQTRGRFPFRVF